MSLTSWRSKACSLLTGHAGRKRRIRTQHTSGSESRHEEARVLQLSALHRHTAITLRGEEESLHLTLPPGYLTRSLGQVTLSASSQHSVHVTISS